MIAAIDSVDTATPDAVVRFIGRHRGGDSVSLRIQRDGESRAIIVTLKAYPSEQMQNATVSYGWVESRPGVRLRASPPCHLRPPGSDPAVLLVQGGGCGSIDPPIGPQVGQPALMHTIGSHGFITMRVEKSGVGDGQGAHAPRLVSRKSSPATRQR